MKKILLSLFMVMFSANVFAMNNKKLEARPVLFLNSYRLISSADITKYEILELKDAGMRLTLQKSNLRLEMSKLSRDGSNAASESEKKCIYAEVDKLFLMQSQFSNEFHAVEKKVSKRIADLSKEYAEKMGACAVIDTLTEALIPFYIDPAYDITARVIDQLNKEYLERSQ